MELGEGHRTRKRKKKVGVAARLLSGSGLCWLTRRLAQHHLTNDPVVRDFMIGYGMGLFVNESGPVMLP